MERTITKKQLQAIAKVCSKDTTRPALTRLAVQDGKLWATDGYIAVAYNLNATTSDFTIDPNKLKMKLSIMKPMSTLTPTDLEKLKDTEEYNYPNMDMVCKVDEEKPSNNVAIDPALLARASVALVDPNEYNNFYTLATYEKSHRVILTNKHDDMAVIMGGGK
jgi:hypothetical protein